jgi:YihY family inner membrane protein
VLAVTSGVLLFLSFVLLIAGAVIAKAGRAGAGWSDGLVTAWNWVRWPIGVLLVVGAVALLFRLSPDRRQPAATWLMSGSLLAVVLWSAFTALLALYLSASSGLGQTYGPLAGLIGILLWAYLSSIALLVGIAFAAQLEAERAGKVRPTTAA